MPFTAIWVDLKSIVLSKSDTERQITWYHFYGDSNGTLFQPRGVGWGERWEGGSKGRGYMYTCGWFMLRFGRKQHNSVKQLSFKKKKKLKKGGMLAQLCLTLFYPWSSPGSSACGILQARILEWVAISYYRASSQPRDRTHISCISCVGTWILYRCAMWEAPTPHQKKKVQMNSFTKQQFWTDPRSETEPASLALEGGFSTAGPPGKFHGLRF